MLSWLPPNGMESDKILTKTMINNYTKNNLLPPPDKKKYSTEHILLLIFIYYFKNILSINDIQSLLRPITDKCFHGGDGISLTEIYNEVFSLEKSEIESMKEDVRKYYQTSAETFTDAPEEEQSFLQLFSFICLLSFDVYVKKQIIENLIDLFPSEKSKRNLYCCIRIIFVLQQFLFYSSLHQNFNVLKYAGRHIILCKE